ncbi:MAG TPA: PspC domain-containing protein [Solirubrobacteraceae bacterium]|jgi:phage shock protein PspC (stress-responsive transcriptional regulator)
MDTTPDTPSPPPPDPTPRRFERSSTDRVIGGVCGGLSRYFSIDATLVRIGMVALALLGGTGLIVYAAALVLVPPDGEVPPGPTDTRDRALAVGVAIALTIAGFALGVFGAGPAGALFPLAALGVAGLAVWWLVSGVRPSGGAGTILRRAVLGVLLIAGCFALAVGSFLASGFGGGVVIAALVIAAGAALVGAAFVGGARWLILPALAIALPLAFVSAAGIDLHGGFGEKRVDPRTLPEVKDHYRIGAGQLVVDLRDVKLPAGDRHMKLDVGAGHVLVLVPDDVCVASQAKVGIGAVAVFDRNGGGLDVDWSDARRAPARTPRLVIDADIGIGLLEVRHDEGSDYDGGREPFAHGFHPTDERNAACATMTASSATSNG